MRLGKSKFRTCALNLLPVEFRNVTLLSEWDLLPPSASLEHCRRANAMVSVQLQVRRQPGFYIQKIGFLLLTTYYLLLTRYYILPCPPSSVITAERSDPSGLALEVSGGPES